tara:strand:+ start:1981 stop:2100 length:120 start_codon:yes stop_codon:yes gene_type:complete
MQRTLHFVLLIGLLIAPATAQIIQSVPPDSSGTDGAVKS